MLPKMNKPILCFLAAFAVLMAMGAPVTIDVRADGASLQFDIDGQLQDVPTAGIQASPSPIRYRLQMSGKLF